MLIQCSLAVRYALIEHEDSNIRVLDSTPAPPVEQAILDEDAPHEGHSWVEQEALPSLECLGLYTRTARKENEDIYYASAHVSMPSNDSEAIRLLLGPARFARLSGTANAEIILTRGRHGAHLRTTRRIPPNGLILLAPLPPSLRFAEVMRPLSPPVVPLVE
ncbi:hypothetical protein EXIGLDRAFT_705706 [Exidia glandulosa HHB12029]|uniref:Uncharacterized protein n=1 Tax=Exidia glandulosa HHB12029 TaxID=1314781 RepID=A0A165KGL2_EXIGL|nr:hypothetical protein EXIGLDRAFT_705706 [Exidia glandulosa HHB12029]